jgi:hypothetical protein
MITWLHVDLRYDYPTPGPSSQIIALGTTEERDRWDGMFT